MMQSLVLKYEQGGWLPIFPCWNSYTAAMIGDHCIAALGDACAKGIRNFDVQKAYEGMRRNAFESPATREEYVNGMGRRALQSYLRYGYIPLEDSVPDAFHTREQVSRTLEYAYDDFVLAQVAKQLGKTEDYDALMHRAQNYRNVIDPRTGYAQGRHADGTFLGEDNAFGFAAFITEGAPCHYTWYVPHDPYGLMECMATSPSSTRCSARTVTGTATNLATKWRLCSTTPDSHGRPSGRCATSWRPNTSTLPADCRATTMPDRCRRGTSSPPSASIPSAPARLITPWQAPRSAKPC